MMVGLRMRVRLGTLAGRARNLVGERQTCTAVCTIDNLMPSLEIVLPDLQLPTLEICIACSKRASDDARLCPRQQCVRVLTIFALRVHPTAQRSVLTAA